MEDQNYLRNLLMSQIQGGLQNKNELLNFNKRAINRSIGESLRGINEDFAGRGTFGSAAQAQLKSNLAGEKALALEKSSQDINLLDTNARQQAIGQFLGLDQFNRQLGFNKEESNKRFNLAWKQFYEGQRQFNEKMEFEEDNQPNFFGSLLGNLLGAFTGGAAGYGGQSLGKSLFG